MVLPHIFTTASTCLSRHNVRFQISPLTYNVPFVSIIFVLDQGLLGGYDYFQDLGERDLSDFDESDTDELDSNSEDELHVAINLGDIYMVSFFLSNVSV